jgi:hypothetical protein
MKFRLSLLLLPVLGTAPLSASVAFDFSSYGTALVSFQGSGDTLQFNHDVSGFDFRIAHATDTGLNGLLGNINGTFTLGAVTTAGAVQEAPVSGTGMLSISDGTPSAFTATLTWSSALTIGTSGALNPYGQINLSNFSYSGTNAALLALASNTSGTDAVSFQFLPATALAQLTADGTTHSTTFSGSVSAVPEPATYAAVIGALVLLGAFARRRSGAPSHAA